MRLFGLHLRILTNLLDSAQEARNLNIRTFQCFLLHQLEGTYYRLTKKELADFLTIRKECFDNLYIHASYWINLASKKAEKNQYILAKELSLARSLGFNYLVCHPGSGVGWDTKEEAIDCIVRVLNKALKHEKEVKILLENTAFGGMSIGSDLYELKTIRGKLDHPEKVLFCLDTAHAYAWGYDLNAQEGQSKLLVDLEATIGDALALIHLNDTQEECGSQKDKHSLLGTGNINMQELRSLILQPPLRQVPIIAEIPMVSNQEQIELLNTIRSWHDHL